MESDKAKWTRRGFLMASSAAVAAGMVGADAETASGAGKAKFGASALRKATPSTQRGKGFPKTHHVTDVCVVGGGMAGLCAAISAARHGAKVVLMHDRPVLGGNASSEVRVHICGADRHNIIPNMRETGILEEIRLENLSRNPNSCFSIWDTVLYEKAMHQPGLTPLLNCSCMDAGMQDGRIKSITGWQLTTQTYHMVEAKVFVDCSGDSILAPLTGAQFRMGREGRAEYGESIAPEQPDSKTMGMTCLFFAREYPTPQPFEPLPWAHVLEDSDIPSGANGHKWISSGYWWVELGGEQDTIHDTERLRDELLKIVYGMWDHIKNRGEHGAENWALDWVQFLPGRRESRRYIGDHVLTQLDIEAEGKFDDLVAYGGWTMDDHHPAGFWSGRLKKPPTIFHHAPSPYGIPFRALYSKNVPNLMFAGRNASATHAAMSSTRVMGTGCSMGQAVGTAAAMAAREGISPRELAGKHIAALQQALIHDDCYLPWIKQRFSDLTRNAKLEASTGDPEPLRDGTNRPVGDEPHSWPCKTGDWAAYKFDRPAMVRSVTCILDSMLDHTIAMSLLTNIKRNQLYTPPPRLAKNLRIEGLSKGQWRVLNTVTNNHQRLLRIPVGAEVEGIRVTIEKTWGSEETLLYALYLD